MEPGVFIYNFLRHFDLTLYGVSECVNLVWTIQYHYFGPSKG